MVVRFTTTCAISAYHLFAYFIFRTHFDDLAQGNDVSSHDSQILHTEQISQDKLLSEQ
jgi:hypothetical protein